MERPVFIRCEDCESTYREVYVLEREQMSIKRGKCLRCIYHGQKNGSLTTSEAQKIYDEYHLS